MAFWGRDSGGVRGAGERPEGVHGRRLAHMPSRPTPLPTAPPPRAAGPAAFQSGACRALAPAAAHGPRSGQPLAGPPACQASQAAQPSPARPGPPLTHSTMASLCACPLCFRHASTTLLAYLCCARVITWGATLATIDSLRGAGAGRQASMHALTCVGGGAGPRSTRWRLWRGWEKVRGGYLIRTWGPTRRSSGEAGRRQGAAAGPPGSSQCCKERLPGACPACIPSPPGGPWPLGHQVLHHIVAVLVVAQLQRAVQDVCGAGREAGGRGQAAKGRRQAGKQAAQGGRADAKKGARGRVPCWQSGRSRNAAVLVRPGLADSRQPATAGSALTQSAHTQHNNTHTHARTAPQQAAHPR